MVLQMALGRGASGLLHMKYGLWQGRGLSGGICFLRLCQSIRHIVPATEHPPLLQSGLHCSVYRFTAV